MTTSPQPPSPPRDPAIRREAIGFACLLVGVGTVLAVAFIVHPLLGAALSGVLLSGIGLFLGWG
ncbi:hypothetical protein JNW90_01390 [Micromonospora sp. STR1s_5]|nr:hypothetical protein [Micromonospora sp. STR1s_5]